MKTILAKPLSKEAFEPFGTYSDFFEPSGPGLGDFYPDRLQIPVARGVPFGFSPLVVRKPEKYLVDTAEYHNFSGEILVPIDGDIIIHVAPASNEKVPERTEAYIVPMGTVVHLLPGVWHYCPFAIERPIVHCLIGLPVRTYMTDVVVVHYDESEQIEIKRN